MNKKRAADNAFGSHRDGQINVSALKAAESSKRNRLLKTDVNTPRLQLKSFSWDKQND